MRIEKWKKIVTVLFLTAVMLVFGLTSVLKWRSIGKNVYHVLRDFDNRSNSVWTLMEDVIDTFEGNFNNFLWGGKELASLNTNLNYLLKGEIDSVQVLLGEEDWLFYQTISDGEPMVDYCGSEYFPEGKMEEIAIHLSRLEEIVASKGMEFVVLVCPNKEQVMEQYMPKDIERESDESRTDRLLNYLRKKTALDIVYPMDELAGLSKEYDLYYHYDTHWNALGGYVAVQQLAEILGAERGYLTEREITALPLQDHSSGDRDLARIIGMTWHFDDEQEYILDGQAFDDWDGISFTNDAALVDKRVMVVGDSFRIGMKPALSRTFSEVLIIHRDEYTIEMLDEFAPDVVVLEYVERYSGEMAGFLLN